MTNTPADRRCALLAAAHVMTGQDPEGDQTVVLAEFLMAWLDGRVEVTDE